MTNGNLAEENVISGWVQGKLFDGESAKSGSDDGQSLGHMDGGMKKWKMK